MSKNNKKKLRRLMRAQTAQNAVKQQESTPAPKTAGNASGVVKEAVAPAIIANNEEQEETRIVKKEIRKILITVFILIISIVVVYFVNTKTDFVLKLGEWLSKTLNISV